MLQFESSKTPQSLVTGFLKPQDIKITVSPSNLELTQDIEDQIESIWQIKQKEAIEKDLNFYNGTSYRLNSWKYENKVLFVDFGIFDYKHRYGLVTLTRKGKINESLYRHNGCYVGGTVKTVDGKYLMVKLTGKSTNPNKYEILGGMLETDVACNSGKYIFDVMEKELKEEADIQKEEISNMTLRMFFTSTVGHIGFYTETELTTTARELQDRAKNNDDVDIESLLLFNKEEYVDALRKHSALKEMFADIVEGKLT